MPHFSGVIPPIITPFGEDGLEVNAVDRIVEHLIGGGVNGIFVLGTTGEGPSLSKKIQYEMVRQVCATVKGRVPVLVNVTDCCFQESLCLAQHAAQCEAAAVVSAVPYYFPLTQHEALRWFQELASASAVPVVLYNMPSCVGLNLERETVRELSKHSNIVGIKDSSGDLDYFRGLCVDFRNSCNEFSVLLGPEELIPSAVEEGAHGSVCGGANLLPHVYVQLYSACTQGNRKDIERLSAIVEEMFEHIYRDERGDMKLIAGLKYALKACGLLSSEAVAPPLSDASEAHCKAILENLPKILQTAESPLRIRR
jgi:4-hydroxy-tetrahydrodipicolinate synthase